MEAPLEREGTGMEPLLPPSSITRQIEKESVEAGLEFSLRFLLPSFPRMRQTSSDSYTALVMGKSLVGERRGGVKRKR